MAEADDVSMDDLRKAVLNLADAVRVITISVDRLAFRLAHSPIWELDPSLSIEMNNIRETIGPAKGRLSAAVELLVKDDVGHSS
ncbi:MAG TPA: hypothetical protein VMF86_02530 [Stellaceae bacterium]|nr:hypothetical protein [Stellaceae bacterium]